MSFPSDSTRSLYRRKPHLETLERRDTPTAAAGNALIWQPYASSAAFALHSDPGATKVIYMDFVGAIVSGSQWNTDFNGGASFTVPAWSMDGNRNAFSTIEEDKIISMWRQVAEDYAPFDVDVTTQDPGAAAIINSGGGDTHWGVRAVIGPSPGTVVSGSPNAWPVGGGVSYVPSFGDPTDTPVFIWNGDSVANPEFSLPDTVSHEVGHSLGLLHDGIAPAAPGASSYYAGHGAGAVSWGPIMGAPFGRNLTQWSQGIVNGVPVYPAANDPEDDLAVIASAKNGFGYRPDDYSDTTTGAFALNGLLQAKLNTTYGIIGKSNDVDYFSFKANAGAATIHIDQLFVGPNLDIKADLYSSNGTLLQSSNPLDQLNATITLNLPTKGTYYLEVSGTGLAANAVVGNLGYSRYGSLGNYRITGTVTAYTPPIADIRVVDPVRWIYSPSTRTYDGSVTISNISTDILSGSFTFVFTFPPTVTVSSGPGYQVGANYYVPFTGSVTSMPITMKFKLSNPYNITLRTGFANYLTDII